VTQTFLKPGVFALTSRVHAHIETGPEVQTRTCRLFSYFRIRTIKCNIVWWKETAAPCLKLCRDPGQQLGAALESRTWNGVNITEMTRAESFGATRIARCRTPRPPEKAEVLKSSVKVASMGESTCATARDICSTFRKTKDYKNGCVIQRCNENCIACRSLLGFSRQETDTQAHKPEMQPLHHLPALFRWQWLT
jgi:hypothetical protein